MPPKNIRLGIKNELNKTNNIDDIHIKYIKKNSPKQILNYLKNANRNKIYNYKYNRFEKLLNSLKNTKLNNDIGNILVNIASKRMLNNKESAKSLNKVMKMGLVKKDKLEGLIIYVIKERARTGMFEVILKNGFDPNTKIEKFKTYLLHYLIKNQTQYNGHLIYELIKHGADANLKDDNGETPITLAIKLNDPDTLAFLLDSLKNNFDNINIHEENKNGKSLFHYIRNDKHKRVRNLMFDVKFKQSIKKYLNRTKNSLKNFINKKISEGKTYFTDPITKNNINLNTLIQINGKKRVLPYLGVVLNTEGNIIGLTDYIKTKKAIKKSRNWQINHVFYPDYSLVPINSSEYPKIINKNSLMKTLRERNTK